MDIKVLGVDLGEIVCSLAGLLRCVVAMEACGGAHHIGRFCHQNGHVPLLMSPLIVQPYVKVHKNDDRDAEAVAEA